MLLTVFLLVATPLWAQQPGTWSPAADLNQARQGHTATLLPDGKVLIAGGKDSAGQPVAALQLFDPATGSFTALFPMSRPRSQHTATLLKDGRVLIAGGTDGQGALPGLEIYDPGTQTVSLVGATLLTPRQRHSAILLYDSRVLIVGGSNSSGVLNSVELFNPADGTIAPAAALNIARTLASAARLLNGTVLVAGGQNPQNQDLNSVEVYDPKKNTFTLLTALMNTPRSGHLGLRLLNNGKILLAGGTTAGQLVPTVEVYDPVTGTFWQVGSPDTARNLFGANFFAEPYTGILMASGGTDSTQNTLRSSEFFLYPTVRSDKPDYQPGDVVTLMGERWLPNEEVSIRIRESNGDPDTTLTTTTDASGFFSISQFQMNSQDKGVRFFVTVTGQVSRWTAQTSFTDSGYNLDQCANGPLASPVRCSGTAWVNGNLNGSKAHYLEGQSVPYRLRMTDLTIGSHAVTIEWDTTQQGKHAIDYLTSFNRTETTADPCSGVAGCGATVSTSAITADPNVTGAGVTPASGVFTLYGGTITNVSAYTLSGTYAGSSSTRITISFKAAV